MYTYTPKVGEIMAQNTLEIAKTANILHAFGGLGIYTLIGSQLVVAQPVDSSPMMRMSGSEPLWAPEVALLKFPIAFACAT